MPVWNLLERQFNVFTRKFKEKVYNIFRLFCFLSPHKLVTWHDLLEWRMFSSPGGWGEVFFLFNSPPF